MGIIRMDRVPNAGIKELSGVTKKVDKKIDESDRWFGHIGRRGNFRIGKRAYAG